VQDVPAEFVHFCILWKPFVLFGLVHDGHVFECHEVSVAPASDEVEEIVQAVRRLAQVCFDLRFHVELLGPARLVELDVILAFGLEVNAVFAQVLHEGRFAVDEELEAVRDMLILEVEPRVLDFLLGLLLADATLSNHLLDHLLPARALFLLAATPTLFLEVDRLRIVEDFVQGGSLHTLAEGLFVLRVPEFL